MAARNNVIGCLAMCFPHPEMDGCMSRGLGKLVKLVQVAVGIWPAGARDAYL
jgi:hypothetical protein